MQDKKFKPEVSVGVAGKKEETAGYVEDQGFTEEETANQIRMQEEDFLQGLVDAASYTAEERQRIEICRDGKVFFAFTIRPLSEADYDKCKKKHTKYVRNKSIGMKMPESTDTAKYRAAIIYEATIEEDRKKLWDNKQAWEMFRGRGLQVMNGLDVIEHTLKAGEKDRVIECIDKLSGYVDDLEEVNGAGDKLEETVKN
ncbi:MAG: hypothetical protein HFH69_12450 [Lachnospiraceae bacterium]|nr:hypothetical protein [Lachnospiraceae bacterium]